MREFLIVLVVIAFIAFYGVLIPYLLWNAPEMEEYEEDDIEDEEAELRMSKFWGGNIKTFGSLDGGDDIEL